MLDAVKKDLNLQLQKKAKELEEKQSVIEKLRQDLKEEQERREEEIEIIQLEKEALVDEKAELLEKFMESAKIDDDDPLKDMNIEEVKLQNMKLRQAI